MPEYTTLTEKQKEIIQWLNDPHYTVDHLQEWINRNDNVFINAPSALIAAKAKGFFDAVCAIIRAGGSLVVHGRWVDVGEGYVACSRCGEEHGWADYRAAYCEDCGAKMNLEANNVP